MDFLVPFLVVVFLLLCNALFVAAEFALIGAPRPALKRRAAAGDQRAAWVYRTLTEPRLQDRYIAAAQIGITLASLGLGMYGEHALAAGLAPYFEQLGAHRWIAAHSLASAASLALLTYLHIVLGEMVPKSLALMQSEATVLRIARPMRWAEFILYPLILVLNGLGNLLLKAMGIGRQDHSGSYHTPEELEMIVQESQAGGLLKPESGKVIRELLDFQALTAGQVMSPRVHLRGVPARAGLEQLREILRQERHTRYPVFEEDLDHICGMVHSKDLLRLLIAGQPLGTADVRPVAFVPESAGLDTVIDAMRRTRTQMVVVMDEHGGTAGVVVIDDLAAEMVGEMSEGEAITEEIFRGRDGRLRAAGTLRLEELGQHLGLDLEHGEVETISGLVLALLDRPPAVGDEVRWSGIYLRVSAVEGHGVAECIVAPEGPAPA